LLHSHGGGPLGRHLLTVSWGGQKIGTWGHSKGQESRPAGRSWGVLRAGGYWGARGGVAVGEVGGSCVWGWGWAGVGGGCGIVAGCTGWVERRGCFSAGIQRRHAGPPRACPRAGRPRGWRPRVGKPNPSTSCHRSNGWAPGPETRPGAQGGGGRWAGYKVGVGGGGGRASPDRPGANSGDASRTAARAGRRPVGSAARPQAWDRRAPFKKNKSPPRTRSGPGTRRPISQYLVAPPPMLAPGRFAADGSEGAIAAPQAVSGESSAHGPPPKPPRLAQLIPRLEHSCCE